MGAADPPKPATAITAAANAAVLTAASVRRPGGLRRCPPRPGGAICRRDPQCQGPGHSQCSVLCVPECGEEPGLGQSSLWRMAQLNSNAGLFRVTDRVFQVRGLDLANMSIIEGDRGIILSRPPDVHRDCQRRATALLREPSAQAGGGGDLHA
ncbi:hypothetical protein ACU4GD_20135 [Cupriavidus basilensis]